MPTPATTSPTSLRTSEKRYWHEALFQRGVVRTIQPDLTVESSGCQVRAIWGKCHGIDACGVSFARSERQSGIGVVDIHARTGAGDCHAPAIRRPVEGEDRAVLRGELADERRVFADFDVARTIHSVNVGNTILATDHDLVRGRMPRHGCELAVQLVDVLQELSGAGVDQLGGPVASNRDEPFGIDAECGPKHPILV